VEGAAKAGGSVIPPPRGSGLAAAGWAAMAIVALLALVDIAIETFWSESPIRWWVAPPAIAFVALSAWLWKPGGTAAKRWGWEGAASWAIGGLVIMLAATAWLGPAAGPDARMLGQEAGLLMNLVAALVVVTGVIGMTRARVLPVAGIATIAALGLYAVAAYVLAWSGGVPFQASVAGAGFWARLPVFLQGAFLGAFLVLPCSLLLEIVAAVRKQTNPWRWPQGIAALLVVTIAAMGWTPRTTGARSGNDGRARTGASPPAVSNLSLPPAGTPPAADLRVPAGVKPDPRRMAADGAALVGMIPAARYDLVAFANALPVGVDMAFAFVRDQIRYEPYAGILRGSWSTFLTRAGNAADRSLLLATLLAVKGVPVRYVAGTLDQAASGRLFDHVFDVPGAKAGGPLAPAAQRPPVASPDLIARVFERARRDYAVVRTALGEKLQPVEEPSRADVLREISQHVWLQANVDGRWVDLDTAFPDAVPGRSFAAVERTFNEPPEALCQRVTIRVKVERLDGGRLQETTALKSTFNALELLDRDIFLLHAPSAPGGGGLSSPTATGSADEWIPVLRVAGGELPGDPIAFGDRAASMGGILGGAEGPSTFVAEWLEIELAGPAGLKETSRRVLVDRGSPSWRAGREHGADALKTLARDTRGLLRAPQAVHNVWFSAGQHNLAQYATGVAALTAAMRDGTQTSGDAPLDVQLGQLAFQNFAWPLLTDHALVPALNDSPDYRFFADSPRITIISSVADPWSASGAVTVQADLRRDHLRGLARDGNAVGVAERKLWFGLLEGALEHEMLAEYAVASGLDARSVASTSARLGAAGVRVLTGGLPPADVAGRNALVRMAKALEAGATLAAVSDAPGEDSAAWWEIAPRTGDTRAVFGPDLNMSFLGGINYTSSVAPRMFTMVDPMTGMSMDFPIGTPDKVAERALKRGISKAQMAKREAMLRKQTGGNEYINMVKDIALFTLFCVAVMIVTGVVIAMIELTRYLIGQESAG
jgi:transglutaminase-like putative cysteine protease